MTTLPPQVWGAGGCGVMGGIPAPLPWLGWGLGGHGLSSVLSPLAPLGKAPWPPPRLSARAGDPAVSLGCCWAGPRGGGTCCVTLPCPPPCPTRVAPRDRGAPPPRPQCSHSLYFPQQLLYVLGGAHTFHSARLPPGGAAAPHFAVGGPAAHLPGGGSPRVLRCGEGGSWQPCVTGGFGGFVCPNPQGVALHPGGMGGVGFPPPAKSPPPVLQCLGCSILGGARWGQRGTRCQRGTAGSIPGAHLQRKGREKGWGGGTWGSPGVGRGRGAGGPSPPGMS